MSKSLKALEQLKKQHYIDGRLPLIDRVRIETIEKELKALEIIKEKNVDVLRIKITTNVERYNEHKIKGCRNLTKEEYDLLKEVLTCQDKD